MCYYLQDNYQKMCNISFVEHALCIASIRNKASSSILLQRIRIKKWKYGVASFYVHDISQFCRFQKVILLCPRPRMKRGHMGNDTAKRAGERIPHHPLRLVDKHHMFARLGSGPPVILTSIERRQ